MPSEPLNVTVPDGAFTERVSPLRVIAMYPVVGPCCTLADTSIELYGAAAGALTCVVVGCDGLPPPPPPPPHSNSHCGGQSPAAKAEPGTASPVSRVTARRRAAERRRRGIGAPRSGWSQRYGVL